MVRRFGKVMSFSGRLGSSSSANGGCSDSVVPLSISSTSSWDLLWQHDSSSPSAISTTATTSTPVKPVDNIRRPRPTCQAGLAEELVRCRAALEMKESTIRKMREDHETTLSAICRQLLELECGLRKKEKELTTALLQREKVIREQNYLIRVLGKKAGAKKTDIRQLCDEAKSKIPQVEEDLSTNDLKLVDSRKNPFSSTVELTSIVESGSENDSDSAIMLDDERLHQHSSPEMSTTLPRNCRQVLHRHSRTISRSVSDVASATLSEEIQLEETDDLSPAFSSPQLCHTNNNNVFDDTIEDDDNAAFTGFDSAHYRGFLLRHGSYERYKIRAMRKKNPLEAETKGVCTLPRTKTNDKTGVHFHVGSRDAMESTRRIPVTASVNDVTHSSITYETKTCGKNSSTVVMINTDQESFCPGRVRTNTNHRRITKPRDVKNRNNSHKTTKLQQALKSPPDNSSVNNKDTNNEESNIQHYVKKSGSVYCSIFLSSDDSYSFA